MSETALDREPIELVEITLPKCVNTFGVAPCTATGTECYNCRATCRDPDNYRDQPDRHLDATFAGVDETIISASQIDTQSDFFAAFEVLFGTTPSGTIWHQESGGTGIAAYLGITSGQLVFRIGDDTVATGSADARIAVDAAQFAGKSMIIYVEVDVIGSPATSIDISLWAFDPIDLTNTLLGSDTWTIGSAPSAVTSGGTDGTYSDGGVDYDYVDFTGNGSITVSNGPLTGVEYLLVGGGGGSGGAVAQGSSGGGGAGGVLTNLGGTAITLSNGANSIVIGTGGAGGASTPTDGSDGNDTTFAGLTAQGGGGSAQAGSGTSGSGGSGGGAGAITTTQGTAGTGTVGQGNDGGDANGAGAGGRSAGGGGGGANAAGANAPSQSTGGDGGDGITSEIIGTSLEVGGGGGGGATGIGSAAGSGGLGGGGAGAANGSTGAQGTAGTDAVGGGAGGSAGAFAGADGGDGRAIIRWPQDQGGFTGWGGDGGLIGDDTGTAPTGEGGGDWNGTVRTAFGYAQAAPSMPVGADDWKSALWLGRGDKGEPTDELYILPCLRDLGTISTRINLSGADQNYQPLGRRATLNFSCGDFTHSDIGQDPYLDQRTVDPRKQSTFWRKWMERQKFGKVGAIVKVYDGYARQALSEYRTRTYVLDSVQYSENVISFSCRDVLSRTEFRKAQVPAPSPGILAADIDAVVTSLALQGDVTLDYDVSGTLRINDEILTYTARAYDGTNTNFTGLTRGTDGSTADAHETDDLAQACRRYTDATIDQVLQDFLIKDSQIQGQLVALSEIESEVITYLDAYRLNTLLTEPQGVGSLIGRLSQECSFYVWWDERTQQVRLQPIRATAAVDVAAQWTYEANVKEGTFRVRERPKERLNVVTYYYNPIDFAGDLEKAGNFRNALKVINGTTSAPEQYGNYIQSREIFSIFIGTEAEANQTSSRLAIRYADIPKEAEWMVDAKDRAIWVGDVVEMAHPLIVDGEGNRLVKRWLIIEAQEIKPGHEVRYMAADITLDGVIFLITDNGIGTYTPELLEAGNAFITDNGGFNSDGTQGARIS